MRLIVLEEAKLGDEVAEPVLSDRGVVILPRGAKLTPVLVDRLRKMGVHEIVVEGVDPNAPPPKSYEELTAELETRFEGVDRPLMVRIKRIASRHLDEAHARKLELEEPEAEDGSE